MKMSERQPRDQIDWNLTTWEGSRRDQLARWAKMSLEEILEAQEEMGRLAAELSARRGEGRSEMPSSPARGTAAATEASRPYGPAHEVHRLVLAGCRPEPLMAYLKALAVLRLVSEQRDPDVRGWWENGTFCLETSLNETDLLRFFLEQYVPTAIVVPWSGSDFLMVDWEPAAPRHRKTPSKSGVIEAFLATTSQRLEPYRVALRACRKAMKTCGIDTTKPGKNEGNSNAQDLKRLKKERKAERDKQKWRLIRALRSECTESHVVEWIDAAAVTELEKFASLLGSGGGNEGNFHFSNNFMQNLWDVLPDFDEQHGGKKEGTGQTVGERSMRQLRQALFGVLGGELIPDRSSSLFDSGAVGGVNATQGMERDPLSNPWDVILGLEGTVCFASAAAKRLETNASVGAAFPFQVSASLTRADRSSDKEEAAREMWLPLWSRPARSEEVLLLLREGRAQCAGSPARSGLDMARAVASLGVDRGIEAFHRYIIVRGRVGGDKYNTASSLGRFEVIERREVDLLGEVDGWLHRFRAKAGGKNAPARFKSSLRDINSSIFEFCKYGGPRMFQEVLASLGRAERALALTEGKIGQDESSLRPLAGLSIDWAHAGDDGSVEFSVACAIASIHDQEGQTGPVRANLEPVDWKKGCRAWTERGGSVVWSSTDVCSNLAAILGRRLMDGSRAGCKHLPLASGFKTSLESVAAFLAGEFDERRAEDLIWGLVLVGGRGPFVREAPRGAGFPLPRAYALLKLLFLPRPLLLERGGGRLHVRYAREDQQGAIAIKPEPATLHLLRRGRVGEACALAMRRLRACGLTPMPRPVPGRRVRDDDWLELDRSAGACTEPRRLAAALLIPIRESDVNRIVSLVCSDEEAGGLESA